MVVLWASGLQPRPLVDRRFLAALLPVALFHTVGHVSACVSFSQVRVRVRVRVLVRVRGCVRVCVCVCVREREGGREGGRETERGSAAVHGVGVWRTRHV
jgi:hypothetical protein